jgi:hypothetical protein
MISGRSKKAFLELVGDLGCDACVEILAHERVPCFEKESIDSRITRVGKGMRESGCIEIRKVRSVAMCLHEFT